MFITLKNCLRTAVFILLLSVSGVLSAGEDAVLDRGFQPDAVYDTHDIDEVNQFNGNLTVHIPLGSRYRSNGSLEYGFTLYYNSNMWDYSEHAAINQVSDLHTYLNLWTPLGNDGHPDGADLTGSEAYPSNTLNTGLGWIVSMGDLYRDRSGEYFWVAPDGGKHLFYTLLHQGSPQPAQGDVGYTRDGTYIRMSALNLHGYKYRVLQFPNGVRHRYRCVYQCDSPGGLQHYEFNQMADPFGNVLYVTSSPRPSSGEWTWTYVEATLKQDRTATGSDAASADVLYADSDVPGDLTEVRRHEMVFDVDNIAYMRLKSLSLAGPGGTPATYTFNYTTHDIYRPYGSTWYDSTDMVYPVTGAQDGKLRVKVLRSVTLPGNAGSWNFDYYNTQPDDPSTPYVDTQPDDPDTPWNDAEEPFLFRRDPFGNTMWWYVSRYAGQLSSIVYPTGGKVQYRYTGRAFPKKECYTPGGIRSSFVSVAVLKRQLYRTGAQGVFERDPQGLWMYFGNTYRDHITPTCNVPVEMISTSIDPLGNTTLAYFSVFLGYLGGDLPPWNRQEYGMQVSKMDPPEGDRYLSSQTYRCDLTQFTGAPTQSDLNQRLRYIVTRLRPDGTPGTCGNSVRSTYVKFEHSGFECDPNGDASTCFAANRRLAREHIVFHDDNDSFADTDWTNFDGVGHYRTTTKTGGGLLATSPARVETINYNPGSSETSLPTFWLFDTYDRKTWDENNVRALALYDFDARSGFLKSERAVTASGRPGSGGTLNDPVLTGSDVLKTYERHRESADGTLVAIEEESYGGDRLSIGSTPEFRMLRKFRYGTEAYFAHLTSTTPVVHYDRVIDPSSGVILSETAASGLTARFEYDVLSRPTKAFHTNSGSQSALSGEASLGYEYKPAGGTSEGQLAKVTVSRPAGCSGSACESQTTYIYGLYGRLFVTKGLLPNNSSLSRMQQRYLANGWPSAVSTVGLDNGAVNESSSDQYDPFGRVGRIKNAAGQKIMAISYGGIRTIARQQFGIAAVGDHSDPNEDPNPITSEEYDRHGRLIKLSDRSDPLNTAAPALAVYGYDVMNRLVAVDLQGRSGSGSAVTHQKRSFEYDNRGFLISETHPELDATVRYRYDSAGHVFMRTVDGHNELRLTYSYDDAGRLTDVVGVNSNGNDRPYQHFTYFDGNDDDCGPAGFASGKLKSAARHNYIPSPAETAKTIDVTVTDSFAYASGPGWLSRKATTVNSTDPGYTRKFTFSEQFAHSPLGLPSLITYPSCTGCGSLVLPERRVTNSYKAGALTSVGGYATKISYHPNGLYNEVQHTGAGNGVSDLQLNDANGMPRPFALYTRGVMSADGTHSDNLNPDGRLKYDYDTEGNLAGIGTTTDDGNPEYRRYRYDSMSRLRRAYVGAQPMRNYHYDRWGNLLNGNVDANTNRLASAAYDALGNMISWGAYVYQFDALNAMTYVRSPLTERMFLYDANNERIGSIDNRVAPATPDDPPGRRETWTVRDSANKILRTISLTNGTWAFDGDYIYRGSSLLASDGPEGIRHFHLDHLGTVRMITDSSNRVVSRHVYFPFGEEISDPDSDGERMKFAGHERDNLNPAPFGRDGDLDYMHARFYNQAGGRFLSVDPVLGTAGSSQSWNRYAYANNQPVVMTDPDGRAAYRPPDRRLHNWREALNGPCLDGGGNRVIKSSDNHTQSDDLAKRQHDAEAAGGLNEPGTTAYVEDVLIDQKTGAAYPQLPPTDLEGDVANALAGWEENLPKVPIIDLTLKDVAQAAQALVIGGKEVTRRDGLIERDGRPYAAGKIGAIATKIYLFKVAGTNLLEKVFKAFQ